MLRFGFPTEEVKHLAWNFCHVYFLPRELQLAEGLMENSDNEGVNDEVIPLTEEDLAFANLNVSSRY